MSCARLVSMLRKKLLCIVYDWTQTMLYDSHFHAKQSGEKITSQGWRQHFIFNLRQKKVLDFEKNDLAKILFSTYGKKSARFWEERFRENEMCKHMEKIHFFFKISWSELWIFRHFATIFSENWPNEKCSIFWTSNTFSIIFF